MDHKLFVELVSATVFGLASLMATFFVLASQINTASERRGSEPRCPECGMRDARLSSSARVVRDRLFGLFSCAPFRCRRCGSRFYWRVEEGRFRTEPL